VIILTARLFVRLDQALDPVKAGNPTSESAVLLSWKCESKTAVWSYMVPFAEKREVDNIGKDNDYTR
jgi:hypothetical protein